MPKMRRIQNFVLAALQDGSEREGRKLRRASALVFGRAPGVSAFYRATHILEEDGLIEGRSEERTFSYPWGEETIPVRLYRLR